MMKRIFQRVVQEERGNVESSLVILPLILLFLATFQIIVAINFKSISHALVQSEATQQAITGRINEGDRTHRIDLYNDIQLLVIERVQKIPSIIPGLAQILGRAPSVNINGVAVIEGSK